MRWSAAKQLISITAAKEKHPLTHLFTRPVYTLVLNKAASLLCVCVCVCGDAPCCVFWKRAEVSVLARGHQSKAPCRA